MELEAILRYRSTQEALEKHPDLIRALRLEFLDMERSTFRPLGLKAKEVEELPTITLDNGHLEYRTRVVWEGEPEAFHKAQYAGVIPIHPQKCLRCDHEWQPRIKKMPVLCPKCKSPYWSTPRKGGADE